MLMTIDGVLGRPTTRGNALTILTTLPPVTSYHMALNDRYRFQLACERWDKSGVDLHVTYVSASDCGRRQQTKTPPKRGLWAKRVRVGRLRSAYIFFLRLSQPNMPSPMPIMA